MFVMLFSSVARAYKCPDCERTFSSKIPTSFIPITFVIILSVTLWGSTLAALYDIKFLALFGGLILTFVAFASIFLVLEKIFVPWEKAKLCPKCSSPLENIGGGFIDGSLPDVQEILLYLGILAMPLILKIVVSMAM